MWLGDAHHWKSVQVLLRFVSTIHQFSSFLSNKHWGSMAMNVTYTVADQDSDNDLLPEHEFLFKETIVRKGKNITKSHDTLNSCLSWSEQKVSGLFFIITVMLHQDSQVSPLWGPLTWEATCHNSFYLFQRYWKRSMLTFHLPWWSRTLQKKNEDKLW